MNTTLNAIREHTPCEDSWKALLLSLNKTEADDEPLPLRHILDTLEIEDAIWSLRSLEGADREIRLFSCDCAERVLHLYEGQYPDDMRPRQAIEVARRYANGEATDEELTAARDAADAAGDAADADDCDAREAAWAAWAAAREDAWVTGTAGAAEREAQRELFIQYFTTESK